MKLLFLDVDGVLNTSRERNTHGIDFICSAKLKRLRSVVDSTGCELVLSSDWRRRREDLDAVKSALAKHEMQLFGTTAVVFGSRAGVGPFSDRATEISDFLASVDGVTHWVVVDDFVAPFCGKPGFDRRVVMTKDWGKDGGLQPIHCHQLKLALEE